ncbi:MAG TPA: TonB-dependent receptor [Burkholderiaceae bacterium]|nr:TonB-dependent receptor [Burkholderiaceae bacterium]
MVVTASRFANDPAFSPIGASVISAEQIRDAGVADVNQAIRKIGGVFGRQNPNGTADYSLDLRGFGATSDQNMVILLDGVRLSEKEMTTALLSSIPIESVERIEIVRGGSSVLYGEGATGGTIQIITKQPQRNRLRGSVVAEAGSYGYRELRFSLAKGWDNFAVDANLSKQRADNYRANNANDQGNFSGGIQWGDAQGRVGLRVDVARQDNRFPGALTQAAFEANPRQTVTPNDFGSYDVNRYTLFSGRRFGALELAAELSHIEKTAKANFVSFGSESTAKTKGTQFSPRLRHLTAVGDWKNELVAGLDFANWSQATVSTLNGHEQVSQKSQAIYLQNQIQYQDNARLVLGARHENFDKDSFNPNTNSYRQSFGLNAWDVQGSYAPLPLLRLFAKAGQSYRVANVDDNREYGPRINPPLKPQTSHDFELGANFGDAERKLTVKAFEHRLTNEIMNDPTPPAWGANVNLDPTRRRGVELEASLRLHPQFTALANFQHVSATFTDGPNAGREVVLVPRNTASVRLNWNSGRGQNADVGMQWASEQRYGSDFDNSCRAKIPSFVTLDARYSMRIQKWELALAGSNLTGRDYFSQAYGFGCTGGIYPEPGRQLKLTARYDF